MDSLGGADNILCIQVFLEALPGALPMQSQPCLWMQMHGPDGLTQPLPFHSTQGGQREAFDCTAEAVGPLTHLTVWLEPLQVNSHHCSILS